MSTQPLAQAFASTRAVLAGVRDEQLDLATPCASWDVRALVNHIVGGSHWFAICMENGQSPDTQDDTDFAAGDRLGAFDSGIEASLAAFDREGALDRMVKLPFGEFSGRAFLGIATLDTFQHGWDLARATGQSTDLAPELAAQLLEQARNTIPDVFRGPEPAPFAPQVAVDDDAPAADRLAGFLGRNL